MHQFPSSVLMSSLFLYRMSIWLVPASSQLMICLISLFLTPSTTQFFSVLSSASFPKLSSFSSIAASKNLKHKKPLLNFLVPSSDFFYLSFYFHFSWSFLTEVLTHLNGFHLNLFNRTYSHKPVYVYTLLYPAMSLLFYNLLLKGGDKCSDGGNIQFLGGWAQISI